MLGSFDGNVIYKHTCSKDKDISYVGETSRQPFRRIEDHKESDKNSAISKNIKNCKSCQNTTVLKFRGPWAVKGPWGYNLELTQDTLELIMESKKRSWVLTTVFVKLKQFILDLIIKSKKKKVDYWVILLEGAIAFLIYV